MILTISYCEKDRETLVRLARWMAELGGTKRHDCLLAYHQDTTHEGISEILTPCFKRIGAFRVVEDATTYPEIANMMWKACANMVADQFPEPWFFMEPDAVPLTSSWLDQIEDEYKACGKPFMLDKVVTPTRSHNSGIGVYPALVRNYTQNLWRLAGIPWDVFLADDFTPHTHHTGLIHDKFYKVWEDPNSGPPVFPDEESLKIIEPGAVLFHRNKDGSLIERLRERSRQAVQIPMIMDMPFSGPFPHGAGLTTRNIGIPEQPASLADRIRFHCSELASLVAEKPYRRQQIHEELRRTGLMVKAKARKG